MLAEHIQRDNLLAQIERDRGYYQKIAFGIVHDWDDAHDCYQDSLVKSMKFWTQYEEKTSTVRHWFTQIVINTAIDTIRRRRWTRESAFDEAIHEAYGASESHERFVVGQSTAEIITQGVQRLPELYRDCLLLLAANDDEDSYVNVAKDAGLDEPTFKSRMFRGRRLLYDRLWAHHLDVNALLRSLTNFKPAVWFVSVSRTYA